jgi:hypothetical protein
MIDLLLTWMVRGDPADTHSILEFAALDLYRAIHYHFDDHERASRISGGRDLRIVAWFVILEYEKNLVSNFIFVLQTLFIFFFVVVNCIFDLFSFLLSIASLRRTDFTRSQLMSTFCQKIRSCPNVSCAG